MEPSIKKQVSVLLRLHRPELAMRKALADGDPDTVWETVVSPTSALLPEQLMRRHYEGLAPPRAEDAFLKTARRASERLVQLQRKVETTSGRQGFVGLTCVDTLKRCYEFGLDGDAVKIAREFKIGERQALLAQVRAVAASRDWVRLSRVASKLRGSMGSAKPPVSLEEVEEIARAAGAGERDLERLKS